MNKQSKSVRRPCPDCRGQGWVGGIRDHMKPPLQPPDRVAGSRCEKCQGTGWLDRFCVARGRFAAFSSRVVRCPLWAEVGSQFCHKHGGGK